MICEELNEEQARYVLDMWKCCGEDTALKFLAHAAANEWSDVVEAFTWDYTSEGWNFWHRVRVAMDTWRALR